MHYPLLVGADQERTLISAIEQNIVVLGLALLDEHHLVHGLLDVELANILPELA